jgi:hypothetical protein
MTKTDTIAESALNGNLPAYTIRHVRAWTKGGLTDATFSIEIPGWGCSRGWRIMRRKDNNEQFTAPPSTKLGKFYVPFVVLEEDLSAAILADVLEQLDV